MEWTEQQLKDLQDEYENPKLSKKELKLYLKQEELENV